MFLINENKRKADEVVYVIGVDILKPNIINALCHSIYIFFCITEEEILQAAKTKPYTKIKIAIKKHTVSKGSPPPLIRSTILLNAKSGELIW